MKDKKFISVQYARAIAALLVVLAHAGAHPLIHAPVWTWVSGRIGITLFFVISGFVMTIVTGSDQFDPTRFLKSRLYRIVPLYWTITLAAAAGVFVAPALFRKTIFDPLHLLASLFFVPMLRPGNPEMIEPFVKLGWTLNYEMFFYLVFAGLFFTTAGVRTIVLLVFFTTLTTIGQLFSPEQTQLRFYTSYDLLAFAVGCGLGIVQQRSGLDRIGADVAAVLGGISSLAILLVFVFSTTKAPRIDRQLLFITISAGVLITGLVLERSKKMKRFSLPIFIGDASYSIYLGHMFIVGAVAALAGKLFGQSMTWLEYILTVAAGAVGGAALGTALFVMVERPLMRLLSPKEPVRSDGGLGGNIREVVMRPSASAEAEIAQ